MKITKRKYKQSDIITFRSTKREYGGLSNMASEYSLFVNEINISTSEGLYQACRFPLFPDIQEKIILESNPMEAKKISRKYTHYTRQDWEYVKFDIMRWCIKVKLLQNWDSFGEVLRKTQGKTIVEYSTEDKVWAACPVGGRAVKFLFHQSFV